jgi:hypothetical protein
VSIARQMMQSSRLRSMILWSLGAAARAALAADDPCSGFRWDVGHEHALFATAPELVTAGKDAASAPALALDRLYELVLTPQRQVIFAVSPGKKMPVDGGSAGLARLKLTAAGDYRVSLNQGFWVDIVADHQLIAPSDFQGRRECDAPHKIVVYSLPGGRDLILQFSGSAGSGVRLTITPVRTASPANK